MAGTVYKRGPLWGPFCSHFPPQAMIWGGEGREFGYVGIWVGLLDCVLLDVCVVILDKWVDLVR